MSEYDIVYLGGDDDGACPRCGITMDLTDYRSEDMLHAEEEVACAACKSVFVIDSVDWRPDIYLRVPELPDEENRS